MSRPRTSRPTRALARRLASVLAAAIVATGVGAGVPSLASPASAVASDKVPVSVSIRAVGPSDLQVGGVTTIGVTVADADGMPSTGGTVTLNENGKAIETIDLQGRGTEFVYQPAGYTYKRSLTVSYSGDDSSTPAVSEVLEVTVSSLASSLTASYSVAGNPVSSGSTLAAGASLTIDYVAALGPDQRGNPPMEFSPTGQVVVTYANEESQIVRRELPLTGGKASTTITNLPTGGTLRVFSTYEPEAQLIRTSTTGVSFIVPSAAPAATAPGQVTGLTLTPGDQRVTVEFGAPANDGGSAVLGYEISIDGGPWANIGTGTKQSFGGFPNGTSVSVKVRATNAVGSGTETEGTVTPSKPVFAPGKVSSLRATAGDESARIAIGDVFGDGGSPVTGYEVQVDDGEWRSIGRDQEQVVRSLKNGVEVTISVRAVNVAGAGAARSVTVTPVKPIAAPGKVARLAVAAGDASATVVLDAPTDDGGSAVTRYELKVGDGDWSSIGLDTQRVVTGLTNGTPVAIAARAVNSAGAGDSVSETVTPISPVVSPGVVTNLSLTPGDRSAKVTFGAPVSDGGSAVTRYEMKVADGSWTTIGLDTSRTVSGLANGSATTVAVRAVNVAGTGSEVFGQVTPVALPAKAAKLVLTPGDASAKVSFAPATSSSTSPVRGYEVQVTSAGAWIPIGTATTYTATGMTNGRVTTIAVRAVNDSGPGAMISGQVRPVGPPTKVTSLVGTPGDGSVRVAFAPPASNGGETVTRYEVKVGTGAWTSIGSAWAYNAKGLRNGIATTISVRAVNSVGAGAAESVTVTPAKPRA